MKILRTIDELSAIEGPVVLAAGTFDGLHLGHQALIRRAQEEAFRLGGTAVVLTFDRHPASVTRPDKAPKLLTSNQTKMALLERLRVPVLLLLEFNEALATVPAEEFIASIAAAAKPLHKICLGSQWSFGRGGAGDIFLLEKLGGELGFSVESITAVEVGGKPISSTRIRKAIATGNFHEASACLGRSFLLIGDVVPGAGLGATIGFPTANLAVEGMQLPPDGVYAVRVQINNEGSWSGVANVGVRPTVDHSMAPKRSVEVHLFDQHDNLVGKELAVEFVEFLRGEHKFPDLAALTAQISSDCKQANKIFRENA